MKAYIRITDDKGKDYEGEVDLTEIKPGSKVRQKSTITISKIPDKILNHIAEKMDEMKFSQMVLIVLKYNQSLTKSQQKTMLKSWGKKVGGNFESGNYKKRLIDPGLIHEVGQSGGETVYGLTAKGKIEAEKILKQLEEGTFGKK